MNGRFVRSNQHTASPQIAQFAHRRFGFLGQTHEPLAVILKDLAGIGERATLGRTVEELFPQIGFEASDGLTDGWLRAMDLGGGAGKAPLLRNGQERLQCGDIHVVLGRPAVSLAGRFMTILASGRLSLS